MLDKQTVFEQVHVELAIKLDRLQVQFDELRKALTSETKSTAGDKHETGRAMAQLEQEKLGKQLTQTSLLRDALSKVNPSETHDTIQYGSLVQTSKGYFFFSIGLGKINVGNDDVFCMTATSPLGQKLLGKTKGNTIQLNGTVEIIEVR
jgi:hypothetical protein